MGVAGIALAVLAIAFTIIRTIGPFLAAFSIASGLVLSIIGLFTNRRRDPGFKSAILGIAANLAVIALIWLWIYLLGESGVLGSWES